MSYGNLPIEPRWVGIAIGRAAPVFGMPTACRDPMLEVKKYAHDAAKYPIRRLGAEQQVRVIVVAVFLTVRSRIGLSPNAPMISSSILAQ